MNHRNVLETKDGVAPGETLLYSTNGVSPTRIVSIVALAFALGSFILAALLLDKKGGVGNFISATEKTLWAAGIVVLFVGFAVLVTLYQRRVAARVTLLGDGQHLRITTPTLFGSSDYLVDRSDLVVARYHDGDRAGEEASNQPYLHVQVRGQPRSFVVPLHGAIPNKERLLQVLSAVR